MGACCLCWRILPYLLALETCHCLTEQNNKGFILFSQTEGYLNPKVNKSICIKPKALKLKKNKINLLMYRHEWQKSKVLFLLCVSTQSLTLIGLWWYFIIINQLSYSLLRMGSNDKGAFTQQHNKPSISGNSRSDIRGSSCPPTYWHQRPDGGSVMWPWRHLLYFKPYITHMKYCLN